MDTRGKRVMTLAAYVVVFTSNKTHRHSFHKAPIFLTAYRERERLHLVKKEF